VGSSLHSDEYAIALRPVDEAKKQLSFRYGHFSYLWSRTGAMDASLDRFLAESRRDPNLQLPGFD
jgi:hypothetical protein